MDDIVAAAGDIESIDAGCFQPACSLFGILNGDALRMKLVAQGLVRAETENDGEVRSADSLDLLDDFNREEVAVYAVVVDAVIGDRTLG